MSRISRKWDHIELAVKAQAEDSVHPFEDARFVHHALPECGVNDVSLQSSVAGQPWEQPLYINAMTGGAPGTERINRDLAEIARDRGIAMAVGSQTSGLTYPDLEDTYRIVRKTMGTGIVLANLGANATLADAERAVDMLQANYLQLHLNPVQELIMPEGDRTFSEILKNIEQLVHHLSVPVIVKEVGFGMARELYHDLLSVGVRVVDVSGRGGTNFAWIESQRRQSSHLDELHLWGQTTIESLLEAQSVDGKMAWVASGGIRSSLDMVKAFALGARAVGVAGAVLRALQEGGQKAANERISTWLDGIKTIMTLLGAKQINDLTQVPLVITGKTREWCIERGIDTSGLARRRKL